MMLLTSSTVKDEGLQSLCSVVSGVMVDLGRCAASHAIEIEQEHTQQPVGVVVLARDEFVQRRVTGAERARHTLRW